ncbi:MAG: hypothetical protein K2J50_01090 [Treponemataceae bacterium]|nr:hypothetical protein [Treponemataceae bacterium]
MKQMIFAFILLLHCLAYADPDYNDGNGTILKASAEDGLALFFFRRNYETEEYPYGGLFFSYTWADELRKIIDRGMLYKDNGTQIDPLLIFDGASVSNSEGVLFTCVLPSAFYGWKISLHGKDRNYSVSAVPYSDEGKSVTDGVLFVWDDGRNAFKLFKQDRCQW